MDNFELDINQRIEVISNDRSYKSLITDIDDDDSININVPVYENEYLVLHKGEVVEINVYLDNGKCYEFNCKVISKGKEGIIPFYKLSEPFNIKRIQRRDNFRVSVMKDVTYRNISQSDNSTPYIEAVMIDLSGGGAKLKINEKVNMHDRLAIKMVIKGIDILVEGEVIRIEISDDKQKLCGVKFLDISQSNTDRIIEELFEIMRKQRALI